MTVNRPCYTTRQTVKQALDVALDGDYDDQVDQAVEQASADIDVQCHRRFYTALETHLWDWPNYQRAAPWRIWLGEHTLAEVTATVPVVTTGGRLIPADALKWGPWQSPAPPFTFVELDRARSFAFGVGATPQQDVSITGLYGWWNLKRAGGALAAALSDTTGTLAQVTNGAVVGVGDVLTIDTETLLVADMAPVSTGVAFAGLAEAAHTDTTLAVPDGTVFARGEILTVDTERCRIRQVLGNNLVLARAVDGTILAAHTSGTLFADRLLTLTRGALGSSPAAHLTGAAIQVALVPPDVRELATAEALNTLAQHTAGYARTVGENERVVPGGSLPDLRKRVRAGFARKARTAVI